jgi:hypothetical protein
MPKKLTEQDFINRYTQQIPINTKAADAVELVTTS